MLPKNKSKKNLIKYLNKNNIYLSGEVWHKPAKYNLIKKEHMKINLPNSEDVCSRHICLPIYLGLSIKNAEFISKKIIEFIK